MTSVPDGLHERGEAFAEAEREVLAAGEQAVPALEAELEADDPIRRLTARALLDRVRGTVSTQDVLGFFEGAEEATRDTILPRPPAAATAAGLARAFGEAAAPLVAMYLVKHGEEWAGWQARAAAIFVAKSETPETNEALARFAATTADEALRADVLDVLVAYGGPGAATALRSELDRSGAPERHANARPALEAALQQTGGTPA